MHQRMGILVSMLVFALVSAAPAAGQAKPATKPAPAKPAPAAPQLFTTPLTLQQMSGKQAVIETTVGRIIIDLLPNKAPNHVGYFIKLAQDGAYDGTTFHRLVKHGIIQGGDPLSKDPAKAAQYGTGGLRKVAFEQGAGNHVRGAVSAVLLPGNRDSAGSQFFICITPQPVLDGQYTMFGRVVEGIGIATLISEAPVDAAGKAPERIEMTSVTIRDAPPAGDVPFTKETAADLAQYRAVLETSLGNITIEFMPDKAPEHVRQFLRLASAGVYDHVAFHRVMAGFMIQTGYLGSKQLPLDDGQQALVHNLQPEFSDTRHDKGIVSMARGDDPASATTSFFIVTSRVPSLDMKYSAFGRVADGMSVVEAIEQVPCEGEVPKTRVEVKRVRVVKQ
jgi:peptidyl-prolyl cis-trans isomerase B (cyclophilin B)